jgi:hypothetical protein
MGMKLNIKFNINFVKTIEAIVWCLDQSGPKDMRFILKWLFCVDKFHIQKYIQSEPKDTYINLNYGPTPYWIFKILQKKKIKDPIIDDLFSNAFIIYDNDKIKGKRPSHIDIFSMTDIEEMKLAFKFCQKPSTSNLCKKTSNKETWKQTKFQQKLDFELFVDKDIPKRGLTLYMKEITTFLSI